jgi:hypothetical protein
LALMTVRFPKSLHYVIGETFDPKAVGLVFRELRERVGLTQGALGANMGGALYQNISRLEVGRGKREPTLTFLSRYARACGWELVLTLRPRRDDAAAQDRGDEAEEDASGKALAKPEPARRPAKKTAAKTH